MDGARGIRSEKLRERQYREGYGRFLEGRKVELDVENNIGAGETGKRSVWLSESSGRDPKECGRTIIYDKEKKCCLEGSVESRR